MDSVTHALAAASLFLGLGRPELVPFAIVGSVLMDIDILLMRFPEKNPRYYVFTHGGVTGQVFSLFIILLAAAEACIALAIVLAIFRNFKNVDVFQTTTLRE